MPPVQRSITLFFKKNSVFGKTINMKLTLLKMLIHKF